MTHKTFEQKEALELIQPKGLSENIFPEGDLLQTLFLASTEKSVLWGTSREYCFQRRVNHQITRENPLNFSTCDSSRVQRAKPVNFKHIVLKGRGSGRGETLLGVSSADKPENCADCWSEEWKERSMRGNCACNLIHSFSRRHTRSHSDHQATVN